MHLAHLYHGGGGRVNVFFRSSSHPEQTAARFVHRYFDGSASNRPFAFCAHSLWG